MKQHKIIFSKDAVKSLEKIARGNFRLARLIEDHVKKIPDAYRRDKMLSGELKGLRRHRVGDYRILYTIEQQEVQVFLIVDIAHRREVYR